MVPNDVFALINRLEKDLAEFYRKLKSISQLNEFVKLFEMMERHSTQHSDQIAKTGLSLKLPELEANDIYEVHDKIKKSLLEQIRLEKNPNIALETLAKAEETIGRLYVSIAKNYSHVAELYATASKYLNDLGEQEFGHRDFILKKQHNT